MSSTPQVDAMKAGTLVSAQVQVNSLPHINVTLMLRIDDDGERAFVSAVPIGPVNSFVVEPHMAKVIEVLYEPAPEPIDLTEPSSDMVGVEFHDDNESVYLHNTHSGVWMAVGSNFVQSWTNWLQLWEQNHAVPCAIYRYERVGP